MKFYSDSWQCLFVLIGQKLENKLERLRANRLRGAHRLAKQACWSSPVFLPGEPHGQRILAAAVHGVMKSWTRLSNYSSLCFSYVCPLDSWGGSHWLHGQGGLPREGQLSFSSILSLFITDGLMIKMTISAGCRLCMVSATWTFPHQGWFLYCVW